MDTPNFRIDDRQARPPVATLLIQAFQVIAIAVLNLLLWPLYAISCLLWHRPPNVPYLAQVKRY